MNTTNIYIPQKIHVGYQNRDDTYTGKLAYVIYTDGKGKKHKEASFDSWRNKEIPVDDLDNEPTEGFVLNKNTGGVENSWDYYTRLSYVRVYDPRGFEFEITIPNLLWILQECNSIKGKGLEGEFVYGWNGKELVLVPTSSADYKQICDNTKYVDDNMYVRPSDVVLGYTYEQKNGDRYIYLGRHDYYTTFKQADYHRLSTRDYIDAIIPITHYSYELCGRCYWYACVSNICNYFYITVNKTPKKFYRCVEESVNQRYDEFVSKMMHDEHYCPIDYDNTEVLPLPFENFAMAFENSKNQGFDYVKHQMCSVVKVYSQSISDKRTYLVTIDNYIYDNNNIMLTAQDCHTSRYLVNDIFSNRYSTKPNIGLELDKLYDMIKPVYFVYKQINGNEFKKEGWYDKDGNKE